MTKGFTLLETLVATSVLIIALLGPVAVATRALSSSSVSTNQIIAYNLAEEGMEYIINLRDGMIFADPNNNEGWDDFRQLVQQSGCQSGGGFNGCDVDIPTGNLVNCGGQNYPNPNCILHRNNSTGLYTHSSGDPTTIFERKIYIPAGNTDEKPVTVTITWQEKAGNMRSFTLERVIFNRK